MKKLFGIPAILVVTALLAASCTRGEHDQPEPVCPNEIIVEDYDGPQHMILGIGESGPVALDIALDNPEIFGASASMSGPVDRKRQLAGIETRLRDFDNLPDRATTLSALRDLFIAFGNPCYDNPDSRFFPPGIADSTPQTVSGFVDTLNPTGALPAITFVDESGFMLDFLLALDANGNGVRDAGEPILLQIHEPFTDGDDDGVFDEGEAFDDVGIDGVAGTGDHGEGDGAFSYAPPVANWLAHDPTSRIVPDLNLTSLFRGAIYADAGRDDGDATAQADALMDAIDQTQALSTGPAPAACLEFATGRYDDFLGEFPYPTRRIFFPEKHARLFWGPVASGVDPHLGGEATQVARWSHALTFLSARLPNGLFGDDPEDTSPHYETHRFDATSLGENVRVEYAIELPAGYYDRRNRWKTYPLLLVLLDRDQTANDVLDLALAQENLTRQGFAQQVVLVMIGGNRIGAESGYHHFVNQAAGEFAGNYRNMILDDLIPQLTDRWRIKVRTPNENQDPTPDN